MLIADEILVAIGRQAAVEQLNLAAAGIEAGGQGVVVNDFLQTTNRRVYAAGDVCSEVRFTHAADAMSRLVLQNALFFGRKRFSHLNIPRTTFTDPEVAQVGLTAVDAQRRGIEIDSYRVELSEVDRAIVDGQTEGFAVIHTKRGSGRVLGGTIVAAQGRRDDRRGDRAGRSQTIARPAGRHDSLLSDAGRGAQAHRRSISAHPADTACGRAV